MCADYHKDDDAVAVRVFLEGAPSPSKARKVQSGGDPLSGEKRKSGIDAGGGRSKRQKQLKSGELNSPGKKRSDVPKGELQLLVCRGTAWI